MMGRPSTSPSTSEGIRRLGSQVLIRRRRAWQRFFRSNCSNNNNAGTGIMVGRSSTSSSTSQGIRHLGGQVLKRRRRAWQRLFRSMNNKKKKAVANVKVKKKKGVDGEEAKNDQKLDDEEAKNNMARLAEAVYSNHLITSRIWPHLSFSDLKAAREVSWNFFDKITNFDGFKNCAVLIVSNESMEFPELFDRKLSMTETWHGIQIDVGLPLEVLDKITHILEHVEFVSFVLTISQNGCFNGENYAKYIGTVLRSTPKLTYLKMDKCFLGFHLTSEVWSSPTVRRNLKNLQSLEILHLEVEEHTKVYDIDFTVAYVSGDHQLPTTLEMPALKSLRLTKYLVDKTGDVQQEEVRPFTRSFLDFLLRHRESLVEVSIPIDAWKASNGICTVTLPHLKSLKASLNAAQNVNFEIFLTNHPNLEEFEINVEAIGETLSDVEKNESLWEVIVRGCAAGSAFLRKVHLKMPPRFWTHLEVNWSFLIEMKVLKDFQLDSSLNVQTELSREALETGRWVLGCLPKNQLERLSLKGMRLESSFLGPNHSLLEKRLERPFAETLTRGFKNLKRLSLRHCPDAVNDENIQCIFHEMTSLEQLEVSHCSRLGVNGLSGWGSEDGEEFHEEEYSIRNLKDLKVLSIRACPAVTPEGLLSVLALPLLQHLDYFSWNPVLKSFVHRIADQNPSLETITVHMNTDSFDQVREYAAWSSEERKSFFKNHPRIKGLHNLQKLQH